MKNVNRCAIVYLIFSILQKQSSILKNYFRVTIMFGFKAFFWDEQIYIGGQAYQSNEILTACLNLRADKLRDTLEELRKLRHKVQLMEGGGVDFCERYDSHVQRAQQIFYQVGNIAKKIPPYNKLRLGAKLDSPLLLDTLNANFYWEDGHEPDVIDDPNFKDEDYCNEFGFVFKGDNGNYGFYNQSFYPDPIDLESDDPNIVLKLRQTNEAVRQLFDQHITFAEDLLRVQAAYSDLLDRYIHEKRKFLSDGETAACFIQYLSDTERKDSTERIRSSGSMKMSHEVYRRKDGGERLCETYDFDSLGAFLYVDFFRGMSRCYLPKRCDNCGKYFLQTSGKYSSYCERPLKDDREKTCRDVGARKRYDDKCKNDPVWQAYNRAYKAHYARHMKKKMTTAEFEQWSRYAVELRDQAESGKLEQAEYERLLKI